MARHGYLHNTEPPIWQVHKIQTIPLLISVCAAAWVLGVQALRTCHHLKPLKGHFERQLWNWSAVLWMWYFQTCFVSFFWAVGSRHAVLKYRGSYSSGRDKLNVESMQDTTESFNFNKNLVSITSRGLENALMCDRFEKIKHGNWIKVVKVLLMWVIHIRVCGIGRDTGFDWLHLICKII